jgi:chemotaxis regulatin CheY-phosphate phosphatase CheZ
MMSPENMSQLFAKLDDLKKVFSYGERLIPVIHSLGEFMKDTVPLLANINKSIAESNAKIPRATNQIQSVTDATELATTEILDLVDSLNHDLSEIEKTMLNLLTGESEKEEFLKGLIPMLNRPDAEEYILNFLHENSSSDKIGELLLQIGKMKTDTESITISLQVQDITTQQLATVNHLIESVQKRLVSLIDDFGSAKINPGYESKITYPKGLAFDPGARYTKEAGKQELADELINSEAHQASQDEIDKLFS